MNKKHITKEMLSEKGMLDVQKYSKQENGFYKSTEWRHERQKYKSLHPFCEVCLKDGMKIKSEIVHHITPISQGGARFDLNNLLAICKKCYKEIHTGIGVKINSDFFRNLFDKEPTPEDDWWGTDLHGQYVGKQKEIIDLINRAERLEKENLPLSIEFYFNAIKQIDDFEKLLNSDDLLEDGYCKEFGVKTFRTVRYPINRLSLLLEKSKKYSECINVIENYENKNDKVGLTGSDSKTIQKRKVRIIQKLQKIQLQNHL